MITFTAADCISTMHREEHPQLDLAERNGQSFGYMQGALVERAGKCVSESLEGRLLDVAVPDVAHTAADAVLHKGRRFYCSW